MFELRNRVRYAICGIYYLRKAHNESSASEEVLNIALETSTRALGASYAHGKTLQPTTRGLKGSLRLYPQIGSEDSVPNTSAVGTVVTFQLICATVEHLCDFINSPF